MTTVTDLRCQALEAKMDAVLIWRDYCNQVFSQTLVDLESFDLESFANSTTASFALDHNRPPGTQYFEYRWNAVTRAAIAAKLYVIAKNNGSDAAMLWKLSYGGNTNVNGI